MQVNLFIVHGSDLGPRNIAEKGTSPYFREIFGW